jgi:hypothetical protein
LELSGGLGLAGEVDGREEALEGAEGAGVGVAEEAERLRAEIAMHANEISGQSELLIASVPRTCILGVMSCSRCGSARADTYLKDGSRACSPCFYAVDTRKREEDAAKNALIGGNAALVIVVPLLVMSCFMMPDFIELFGLVGGPIIIGAVAGVRYGVRTRKAHALADAQAAATWPRERGIRQ